MASKFLENLCTLVYLHCVRESKILIRLVSWENGMNFKLISLDTTEYDQYTGMNTVH